MSKIQSTMMRRRRLPHRLRRAPRWLVPLCALVLSGCGGSFNLMNPAGTIAGSERQILINSLAIMLAIIIPTILGTLFVAWRFRATNTKSRYDPEFTYSGRIEMVTWSIPIMTIMFLGGIAWISSHDLDPAKPIQSTTKAIPIQVVALDWRWLFIYPDQNIATINDLEVPVGVPIDFQITSASVMNVFFVPQFGSQIYAMNGMTSRLFLRADRPGDYHGLSGHFSGDGFSNMRFLARAVPQGDFDNWVHQVQANGPTLDETAYRGLLKQSLDSRVYTYHAVEPNLYDRIVTQKLPWGEGPQAGQPNPTVTPKSKT